MPDWQSIEGWFEPEDAIALRALLAEVPEGGSTAHVGCFQGRHLAACADVIKGRRLSVLAVDTWRGSDAPTIILTDEGDPSLRLMREAFDWPGVAIQFGQTIAKFSFGGTVTVVTRGSFFAAAMARTEKKSFDLVFIDADHSYEAVCGDIMAWRGLLKPGGCLCGHDWGKPEFPGVRQAVEELLPGAQCWPGSSVWWWRPI